LGMAGLIVAIGTVGSQIADAIVLGKFFAAKKGGNAPTDLKTLAFTSG
jgi:hypothetical protein